MKRYTSSVLGMVSLLGLAFIMGSGCGKSGNIQDKNIYQKLQGSAQEILFADSKGTRFYSTASNQSYASVEYPYLVTSLDNKDAFLELHVYDLEQKKMVEGLFNEYDPMLARIDQGKIYLAYDPRARNQDGQISVFDISKNVLRHMPLSVSLRPLGAYAVQGQIFSLYNPRTKTIDLQNISQPEAPQLISSIPISGSVRHLRVVSPWVTWVEESEGSDNLLQSKIQQFNIESKQLMTLPSEYRVQTNLVGDGGYRAYIGFSVACTIGLKKPASQVTSENLAENIDKKCSSGESRRSIVITDANGTVLKKIPVDYGVSDLTMSKGILAWSHVNDEAMKLPLRIHLFDIKANKFYEHVGSGKDIDYSKPLLASNGLIYLEKDRKSYQLLQDRLMFLPLDLK